MNNQSGNVFIIILAGVVLFGMLMFTFSRSGQKGTGNLTKQQAKIGAQEILNYANLIEQAVNKVRRDGCSENEISFSNSVFQLTDGTPLHPDGHNSNTPLDGKCEIFKSTGANQVAQELSNLIAGNFGSSVKPGHMFTTMYDHLGIGKDGISDLIWLGVDIKKEVCIEINNLVGVTNSTNEPPLEDDTDGIQSSYSGDFSAGMAIIGDEAPELIAKPAYCFKRSAGPGAGIYLFAYVLLAR